LKEIGFLVGLGNIMNVRFLTSNQIILGSPRLSSVNVTV